ncbi:DEAD/DEAH box helicase [Salininema proteolyticum]
MNVFEIHERLIAEYRRFTEGGVVIRDERIRKHVRNNLEGGAQWPDPYLSLNPFFKSGGNIRDHVKEGLLHPECAEIFQKDKKPNQSTCDGVPLTLHHHQKEAVEAAQAGDSYVLTTGTGSGKSLSYILPIVDRVLNEPSTGKRVRAIIVYPMNALANSQLEELTKFLEHGYEGRQSPVTFARYTGQEDQSARERIQKNPPDILLTNYVMLELMLTRPEERKSLISMARGLDFLVFDELHTYRGRQGADVAWLIRRVKEACDAPDVQCVGTSATMSSDGTFAEQRRKVAEVATSLFGTPMDSHHVITETLEAATRDSGRPVTAELLARCPDEIPGDYDGLKTDPVAHWIERSFGLDVSPEGELVRRKPDTVPSAADRLAHEAGIDGSDLAKQAIENVLLKGSRATHPVTERPLFAFRLHQFLSRGDNVHVTLEAPEERHITRDYQVEVPDSGGRRLYSAVFCRDCGQEYLPVFRSQDDSTGRKRFRPRRENDESDDKYQTGGYLYISSVKPWPDHIDDPATYERLPDTWMETDSHGYPRVKPHYRDRVPRNVEVNFRGDEEPGTLKATFIPGRFQFCLQCEIVHESTRGRSFGRLAALNQEGRSSATSVISSTIVEEMKKSDLAPKAKKLLSFVDNRQDAALQSGHFNDFVEVVRIRSGLLHALRSAEDHTLHSFDLSRRVFESLGIRTDEYTDPKALTGVRKQAQQALLAVLTFKLVTDLAGGWRVTMPNLEQTGQLVIGFPDLEELVSEDRFWSDADPILRDAPREVRKDLCEALLNTMRRELAIEAPCLDINEFNSIVGRSQSLKEQWRLDENTDSPGQTIVYPMQSPGKGGDRYEKYWSGRGRVGRFVKNRLQEHTTATIDSAVSEGIIASLLEVLTDAGLVVKITPRSGYRPGRRRRTSGIPGYRVNVDALSWKLGEGKSGMVDPLRATVAEDHDRPVNEFFRDLYARSAENLAGLFSQEHTAQVDPAEREDREKRFRTGELSVLYCSPTMELGVDISELNAVMLRNVPPTPANYAQRSGRAGRSGQQALVVTYCAVGNNHDQYYFQNRRDMVAGAVSAPRLDLANEDLIRSHVHAMWLPESGIKLGSSLTSVIDVSPMDAPDSDHRTGMRIWDEVRDRINDVHSRERTARAARPLLDSLRDRLEATKWWHPGWLDDCLASLPIDFERALGRWWHLYRSAWIDRREQHARVGDHSMSERVRRDAESRRRAAELQRNLLLNSTSNRSALTADFSPYRYLAGEGFLPGYSFPRLPIAAYIPTPRQRNDDGDYVQRPRFLAVSEFGPRALIYHEGRKYEVKRVQLPPSETGDLTTVAARRCDKCGYWHEPESGADRCEMCDSALSGATHNLLELHTVYTQRRDRISTDEEERRRAGFAMQTSYRFSDSERRIRRYDAVAADSAGPIAEISYGDSATVRVVNRRLRRTDPDEPDGFLIDPGNGEWLSGAKAENAVGDEDELSDNPEARRKKRVVPFAQDRRNIMVLHLTDTDDLPEHAVRSFMYALERGIETEFQLEDNELNAEIPAEDGDSEFLLFVESAEGGAGVLRQMQSQGDELARAARKALELAHFDPGTGSDLAAGECGKACYRCLLSYGNQYFHDQIDRHAAKSLLMRLAASETASTSQGVSPDDHFQLLMEATESSLERDFLNFLREHGLALPTEAQVYLPEAEARPDFVYRLPGGDITVFIDGPVHDREPTAERDAEAEVRLEDLGWFPVRFRYDDDWLSAVTDHPTVFGTPKKAED